MHAVDELASLVSKENKLAMYTSCWAKTWTKQDVLYYWADEKAVHGHVSARQFGSTYARAR